MTLAAEDPAATSARGRTSPYQGLVPYGEADEEWFFGRDDSRDIVLDTLRAYRVSVLYGESGVGKSSLLRASVLPFLRGSSDVFAVAFSDWSVDDPLVALKERLGGEGDGTLGEVLNTCAERVSGEVYVILDQLEELFLYHGADEAGRAFEDDLVSAIRRRDGAANFVLSIREDALAKLDRLQNRVPNLLDNLVRLEHLDQRAAREAIESPLERWNELHSRNLSIEPALVEQVLAQLKGGRLLESSGGGAGTVSGSVREGRVEAPYLQLVLARIWDEEQRASSTVLRLETLARLGGAEHMVRTHLDAVLAGFSRRDRRIAARAFRYLVTPSGTKIAHRPEDLAAYAGVPLEKLTPVLTRLAGEARILRPVANGAYEIYHDVLAAAVLDWRRRYEEARSRGLLGQRVVLSVSAAIVAIMLVAYIGNVLHGLDDRTMDARFSIRGAHAPKDVAVVGIDQASLKRLGNWPLPRRLHARVIERLKRDGAKVIAFDTQFTEPTTVRDDNALIMAVTRARNVVLATTAVDKQGHVQIFGGDKTVRQAHARPGNSVLPESASGEIRKVPWGTGLVNPVTGSSGVKLESFGVVAAEVYSGRRVHPADLGGSTADIDFAGPAGTVSTVPYWKVLQGHFKPGTFRGRIVVVGATAPTLQDIYRTPVGGRPTTGAEIQANIARTAIDGFPLHRREALDLVFIIFLGMLIPAVSLQLGWKWFVPIGLAAGGLYLVAVQLAFNNDVRLSVVYPLLALLLTTLFTLGWSLRPRPRG